jgi:hypothetical protein
MAMLSSHGRISLASIAGSVAILLAVSCGDDSRRIEESPPTVLYIANRYDFGTQTAELRAGDRLTVEVWPSDCYSRNCTKVLEASCAFRDESALIVDATFRVVDRSGDGGHDCTGDCSGAGTATCEGPVLSAGQFTVELGERSLAFEVPSMMDTVARCTSSPPY